MSVSLVVLRLETADKHPSLKHIEYQVETKLFIGTNQKDREASPSDWPVLVSDRLLAIHRGQREPSTITVISLDEQAVNKEMAAYGTPGLSDDSGSRRAMGGGTYVDTLHFISGNPTVDITQGILHLFKENTKTSLGPEGSRSEMLCLLGVPTSMTIHDLLQFTAPCYPGIEHMRIIRDTKPNQYMVLIKFKTQCDADLFYKTFNGQTFNSIEPEVCRMVYVARVETTSELEEGGLPIPGHSELPTCPVCLERMDESVDGILTILCNHSFHGECLAKWGDTRHFMETNHLFSLQVGNNRVWDYVRDNYVHRLLQSEGDGKMVSYERSSPASDAGKEQNFEDEKMTAIQLECTHLLSSQLESQREYFEAKIAEAKCEALKEVEESKQQAQQKAEDLTNLEAEFSTLKKEKQSIDKKMQHLSQKYSKVIKELETEKQFNIVLAEGKKELTDRVQALENDLKEKDEKIKEMESQMSDIMAHLEGVNTVERNPELQGGDLTLGDKKKAFTSRRRRNK
ncbi:BRCA1-associated protein [Armadillidium vulgare]|nr:BRCA1-associated protein [Armadillidium vulgare]